MAGKTDRTQLQFLYKKAMGFANTSNIFTENEETIPSTSQLSAQTIFGQDVPRAVTRTLNTVQDATAEYVLLTASVLPGTTYDANDTGGGGDGAQSPGPHAYSLQMASTYQADTDNSKAGTFPYTDGQVLYETSGSLQLIGPAFSGNSPNPYLVKLYEDDGSGGVGNEISLTDEIDWLVDYYNGVLFVQDYDSGQIPAFAKAFIYTGNMLSASLGGGGSGPGDADATYVVMSATGSLNAERILTGGTGLSLTDGGPAGNATLSIEDSVVATISGSTFTGAVSFNSGLSGSLTRLTDGTSYLVAGSNVTIASSSNGAITISSTGGGGSGTGVGWIGRSSGQIDTTGSLGVTGSLHALSSTIFGSTSSDFHQFTGSLHLSSSLVGDYGLFRVDHEDNSSILFATGSGRLGINTSTPTEALTVYGNISGSGYFSAALGLSGSLTQLVDGTSYMIAGSNVTITSASNGAVTIASTGGGGGGDITNASNLGVGEGVFAQKTGTILDFKGVSVGAGLNISSNTTTITLTTDFDTLARAKANYEVTQSHPANSSLVMAGVDYSNAAYNPNLIDVFLNGQLLVSGTAPQASAGTVDYSVVASGSLAFGFGLDTDDTVTSIIINNGAATGATSLALNETPSGLVNGINDTFTLSSTPSPSTSLLLFINGQLITQGTDYTLATATITFVSSAIPMTGDILLATYQH